MHGDDSKHIGRIGRRQTDISLVVAE